MTAFEIRYFHRLATRFRVVQLARIADELTQFLRFSSLSVDDFDGQSITNWAAWFTWSAFPRQNNLVEWAIGMDVGELRIAIESIERQFTQQRREKMWTEFCLWVAELRLASEVLGVSLPHSINLRIDQLKTIQRQLEFHLPNHEH